jgi:hypothetical protein
MPSSSNGAVSDHAMFTPMGKELRQEHFLLEETFVNLNHGETVQHLIVYFNYNQGY